MAEHDVLALGQFAELDHALVEPLLRTAAPAARRALDLVVVDDATLRGVDQEHAAGLQATLADDLRRVDVDDADLAGHHDQVVVGDPVAAGPQAVAVEHRPDHGAVGERHAGRAVPRLHQRGVEAVERTLARRPSCRGSPTPRGSSSASRAAGCGRRGATARAPRRTWPSRCRRACRSGTPARDRAADRWPASTLAGAHPVAVALHRVDLAVVGDVAVRMGQRPRRERVGAEAAVHQRQRALHALVAEIGEEHRQLRRGEHALVDQGAAAERREVGLAARRAARARSACGR